MNQQVSAPLHRMRLRDTDQAKAAGTQDAKQLIGALCDLWDDEDEILSNDADGKQSAALLVNSLSDIIGLAVENRMEECQARLVAFSQIVGPALYLAGDSLCRVSQKSAGRIIAARPNDDGSMVMPCKQQKAVRALEPKATETEGGEL